MTGHNAFDQMVTTATSTTRVQLKNHIPRKEFELWQRDYTWEALHGQRYGQSFCNRFGITDNHLYYAPGDIAWCDCYIRENYLA
jgi:hypothetical protein